MGYYCAVFRKFASIMEQFHFCYMLFFVKRLIFTKIALSEMFDINL